MKNKVIYIMIIALTVLLAISIFSNVQATSGTIAGVTISPKIDDNALATTTLSIGNNVIGVIQVAGTAIAIIMLLMLAIKYLKAAPDEKANIKQSAVIYVVGAVTLFAAVNIVSIVATFATQTITAP